MKTMKTLDRLDAISLTLLGGAAALTAALYPRLPEQVPTHFDLHGHANGWMSRPIGATLPLVIALAVWALVRFGAAILPGSMRDRLAASPVSLVGLMTVALFVVIQLLVLWASLHSPPTIGRLLGAALGVYWIALAMVLPRVRRNPFIGIRTAWTLTSDENWARTHRFASVTFTLGGLVAIAAALMAAPAIALLAILVSSLIPVVWSLIVAHRLPPEA